MGVGRYDPQISKQIDATEFSECTDSTRMTTTTITGRDVGEAYQAETEARPRRGVAQSRGGLETEASRPRLHPCKPVTCCTNAVCY